MQTQRRVESPRPWLVAPSQSSAVEKISTFCAFSMRCRQENFASPFGAATRDAACGDAVRRLSAEADADRVASKRKRTNRILRPNLDEEYDNTDCVLRNDKFHHFRKRQ